MGRDDESFRSPDLQRKANLAAIVAVGPWTCIPASFAILTVPAATFTGKVFSVFSV